MNADFHHRARGARPGLLVMVLVGVALVGCNASQTGSGQANPSQATPAPTTTEAASPSSSVASAVSPTGTPSTIVGRLAAPWSVAFVDGVALVSERDSGRILEVTDGGGTREVGTVGGVVHAGESGLLGLAVDGERRLYAYSTGPDGNRIERYALSGAAGSLALSAREVILDGLPSASFHDGGRIAFGPDGMLYATVGDAGQGERAQDLDSLGGKILRLTPDGDVPADNPFPGSLVYSYGHRNPQGVTWAADGTMFATEFGQDTWDELNVITPGGNYGWPTVEGAAGRADFIDPVQQWSPDRASPSGIVAVDGTLFIANLRGRVLRAVPVSDPSTSRDYYAGEYGRIRDVAIGSDGQLWFLTNNTDGRGEPGPDDDRIVRVELAGS